MSEKVHLFAEFSVEAIGFKTSFRCGATGFITFFAGINWIGWLSFGISILGLIINAYFF